MKRLASALILLLLALSTLPHPALASDPATIAATAPDGQHTLYADLHEVELENHVTGQRIEIELAGIFAITWMDAKSALLNSTDGLIFIVDLQGTVFYLGAEKNACNVPTNALYAINTGYIALWSYGEGLHVVYCQSGKEHVVSGQVTGIYWVEMFVCGRVGDTEYCYPAQPSDMPKN